MFVLILLPVFLFIGVVLFMWPLLIGLLPFALVGAAGVAITHAVRRHHAGHAALNPSAR